MVQGLSLVARGGTRLFGGAVLARLVRLALVGLFEALRVAANGAERRTTYSPFDASHVLNSVDVIVVDQ